MKFHILLATTSLLALAACSGGSGANQLGPGDGGGDGTEEAEQPLPDGGVVDPDTLPVSGTETCDGFVCSGDLSGIAFDGTTLTLTGLPFDDDPDGAIFTRVGTVTGTNATIGAARVRNFDIYENTDNTPIPGFNRYLAVYQTTTNDEITVGVAAIEGYQDFGYDGAWYDVSDLTTALPSNGLVEFEGNYVGTQTFTGNGSLFLTQGEVTMQVDFTDSRLKGFITDRAVVDPDSFAAGRALPTLVLNDTAITDGTFEGTANSYRGNEVAESGTYQGFFGGTNEVGGDVMGGLVQVFDPEYDFDGDGDGDTDPDDDEVTARDLGVFTADRVPFPTP